MKKLLLLAALATALIAPARADYLIRDGAGVTQTIRAGAVTVGSNAAVILPWSVPTDPTGTPYAVGNPLPVQVISSSTKPYAYTPISATAQYNLAVTSAALLTVPSNALAAAVCVRNGSVNYSTDGTTPSGSTGMPLPIGSGCIWLQGLAVMQAFQAIQQSATSPATTINVSYYR